MYQLYRSYNGKHFSFAFARANSTTEFSVISLIENSSSEYNHSTLINMPYCRVFNYFTILTIAMSM